MNTENKIPADETVLQRNIRILKEQALKNEKRLMEEKMTVEDMINLQEKQARTQKAMIYLQAIEQKVNPPKIQKAGGNGIIHMP